MTRHLLVACSLVLTACSGGSGGGAAEPAASAEPAAAPIERLIASIDANDDAAGIATFHPRVRAEVEGQYHAMIEARGDALAACLRESLRDGAFQTPPPERLTQLGEWGDDARDVVTPGRRDRATVVRHQGEWYLVDTGC